MYRSQTELGKHTISDILQFSGINQFDSGRIRPRMKLFQIDTVLQSEKRESVERKQRFTETKQTNDLTLWVDRILVESVKKLAIDDDGGGGEGRTFDLTEAFGQLSISRELDVFNKAHALSYEHCCHRNDGVEDITSQNLEGTLLSTVIAGNSFALQKGARIAQDDNSLSLPNTNIISGDERLDLFRRMLDEFNWERQDNQVEFHEMMIKTALPCIFEKEWDNDYDRILRIFGLDAHCAETFIVCPRRFGKTVSVAMFCAVYMYLVPGASIAIFSTAQRTSGKMMLAIYQFMRELPYFKDAIFAVRNSETITINLYGNTRTMWCYPGKVGVCYSSSSLFVCLFVFSVVITVVVVAAMYSLGMCYKMGMFSSLIVNYTHNFIRSN